MRYLFFPGCAATSLLPKLKNTWHRILLRTVGEVEIYDKCCGLPLILTGSIDKAKKWFKENVLDSLSGKNVVTGCPSCYRMLKQYVIEKLNIDPNYNVMHIAELIYQALERGKIRLEKEIGLRITYHDPCELSRHMKIADIPRRILESIPGLEIVEMEMNREYATCCGGGGLMRYLYPSVSHEISVMKIKNEILPLKVDAVVSACPFCEYILGEAISSMNLNDKLVILDIAEIALLAMGEDI